MLLSSRSRAIVGRLVRVGPRDGMLVILPNHGMRRSTTEADYSEEDLMPHQLAETEGGEPWKGLLEMPARAAWRVASSQPPKDFEVALKKVLDGGNRTKKQLRRTHEKTLGAHRALVDRRERERLRVLKDREYKHIEKKRDEGIKSVMFGPDEALASYYFRCFPHYAVIKRVLDEAKSLLGKGSWKPKRVLDFGVGCGSASAASLHVWKNDIEWIHGIDPSETMRQGAKVFLDELLKQQKDENCNSAASSPRITFSAHISSEQSSSFDLAIFAYTASELPHNTATLAAAAVMWEKLRPGGLFVMVEPGTPDGFASVRTVRNMLIACCGPDRDTDENDDDDVKAASDDACHIIAPCTHSGRCPKEGFIRPKKAKKDSREEDDFDDEGAKKGFCSFVQTIGGQGKSEKFSYLVAQKRIAGESNQDSHRFDDVSLTDLLRQSRLAAIAAEGHDHAPNGVLLKKAVDLETRFLASDDDSLGLELLRGDSNRQSFGRIIHAPRKNKGFVLIDCCVAPGKIIRNKISKGMQKPIPGLYSSARKSRWGGFWPAVPELRE